MNIKRKVLSCCILALATGIIISYLPKSQSLRLKSAYPVSKAEIPTLNCGPKVLLEVCKIYNIPATEEELTDLSETENGISSFLGLSRAAKSKGLECVGASTDFNNLKTLAEDNQIIAHFSQNHHFILIGEISDKTVTIYDPLLTGNTQPEVPIHIFLDDWDGTILILNKELKGVVGQKS